MRFIGGCGGDGDCKYEGREELHGSESCLFGLDVFGSKLKSDFVVQGIYATLQTGSFVDEKLSTKIAPGLDGGSYDGERGRAREDRCGYGASCWNPSNDVVQLVGTVFF